MSKIHVAERIATFFAVVFLAAACHADDLVLTQQQLLGDNEPPASGQLPISVFQLPDGVDPVWTNEISATSVGTAFTLDRMSVDDTLFYRFNHFLFNEPETIYVGIPSNAYGDAPPAVTNYHLTRMTLSIDSWNASPLFRIGYTLQVYGLPGTVPEPSSVMLLAVMGLSLCSGRSRGGR